MRSGPMLRGDAQHLCFLQGVLKDISDPDLPVWYKQIILCQRAQLVVNTIER